MTPLSIFTVSTVIILLQFALAHGHGHRHRHKIHDTATATATENSDGEILLSKLSDDITSRGPNDCPVPKGDEGAISTLQSVQIILGHGVRSPLYSYPNDIYANFSYGVQPGQLIPRGKYRSYLVGRCIRQSYEDFMGDDYTPQKLFCQTSFEDPAAETAFSAMAGMYPPTWKDPNSQFPNGLDLGWQPLPCTSVIFKLDNQVENANVCPAYAVAYAEYKASDEAVQFKNLYQWLYRNLTQLTGLNVTDFDDVYRINETLQIQHDEYNLDYPAWYPALAYAIRTNADFSWYAVTATRKLLLLIAPEISVEIADNFNLFTGENITDASEVSRKSKMHLLVGDGTPFIIVAKILGIYDEDFIPKFNAALSIELHKTQQGVYFIKIFYKNGYDQLNVQQSIQNCPDPCTFTRFKEILKDFLITEVEWFRRCQVPPPPPPPPSNLHDVHEHEVEDDCDE